MLPADVPRDELVVAGQDLDGHAVAASSASTSATSSGRSGSAKLTKPASTRSRSRRRVSRRSRAPASGTRPPARAAPRALSRSCDLERTSASCVASSGVDVGRQLRRHRAQRDDRLRRALGDEQPRAASSGVSTTTDSRRRSKSNGISSTFRIAGDRRTAACCRIAASSGLRMPVSRPAVDARERQRPRRGCDPSDRRADRAASRRVVSVPVLSLHRMSMLPRFWIAGQVLHDDLVARHAQRALRERDRARSSAGTPASARRPARPRTAAISNASCVERRCPSAG